MNFKDKIADLFNMSGYCKERDVIQKFLGIKLPREDYDELRSRGVNNIHDNYLGKKIDLYINSRLINEYHATALLQQVIHHFNEGGIIFDIDAPENISIKNKMMRAITYKATNLDRTDGKRKIISFGEEYDQHPAIKKLQQTYINKYNGLNNNPSDQPHNS